MNKDKALQDKFKKILQELLKQEGNRICADCHSKCKFF